MSKASGAKQRGARQDLATDLNGKILRTVHPASWTVWKMSLLNGAKQRGAISNLNTDFQGRNQHIVRPMVS